MSKPSLTIATWDYDRVRAIADGRVPVEGCDVNFIALAPEECFHRAYFNQEFEVAELGFSPFLIAISRGKPPYSALPVFLSRMFRHSAIYIRTDRGISKPEDLRGKKIGVPEYQMSAAMWPRGMIAEDHGVRPDEMHWVQGGLENWGRKDKFPLNLPAGFPLSAAPEGKSLSAMLAAGEIDAIFSARAPSCYRKPGVAVARALPRRAAPDPRHARSTARLRSTGRAAGDHAGTAHGKAAAPGGPGARGAAAVRRPSEDDVAVVTSLFVQMPWGA